MKEENRKIIIKGVPASPGIAKGKVKIINSIQEMNKMRENEILVAPMTSPDYTPCILKALAIVTDIGGRLSHAAIVAREMGIPCVVGCGEATKKLRDNMEVLVDGSQGVVIKE